MEASQGLISGRDKGNDEGLREGIKHPPEKWRGGWESPSHAARKTPPEPNPVPTEIRSCTYTDTYFSCDHSAKTDQEGAGLTFGSGAFAPLVRAGPFLKSSGILRHVRTKAIRTELGLSSTSTKTAAPTPFSSEGCLSLNSRQGALFRREGP